MRGNNPIRKPVKGDGSTLEVKHIFATIQGEGPLAGMPAVFIRLGGCNLACDFCDTDFEDFAAMGAGEIVEKVKKMTGKERSDHPVIWSSGHLVVITGGEPFRQPIETLCSMLLDEGFQVQIETNGTLYRPIDERVMIVCSPKVINGGYHRLREDLLPKLQALKFIISASHPQYKKVEEVGQSDYGIPVYVQPMDEYDMQKNAANLANAKTLALQHGYRLSVQLHKIIGVE